jgi:hypothetical protein
MNLSVNRPSGALVFRKTVENLKYKGGLWEGKEKKWINVVNVSLLYFETKLCANLFRNRLLWRLVFFGCRLWLICTCFIWCSLAWLTW